MSTSGLRNRLHLVAILTTALILLALVAYKPLRSDDFATIRSLSFPISEIPAERLEHNHMPLYFLAAKLVSEVAGFSERGLRVLPGIFALYGKDKEAMRPLVNAATEGKKRLWVVDQDAKRSRLIQLLRSPNSGYQVFQEPYIAGPSGLYLCRIESHSE